MRASVENAPKPGTPTATSPDLTYRALVCICLGAVMFASRAWLAQAWGSAVPFMDEWDVEANGLYRPFLDGTLHLRDLLRAHNEHHLLLTRITDLLLFEAYGRWEPWSQLILNAALHALTGAGLVALLWRPLSTGSRTALVLGVGVVFTSICGWQNALLGIQSQVYYSNVLAVAAIAGLILGRPLGLAWWAGWVAAVLALYAFAGGVFAALSVLAITAFSLPAARRLPRTLLAFAVVALIPLAAFFLFREPPGQLPLHARNFGEYYAVIARCLGWPHVTSPVAWIPLQLPAVWLVLWRARRGRFSLHDRCALALVAFAAFQAFAVAHNRGAGLIDYRPLSRYLDPLLLGVIGQWYCALRLTERFGRPARLLAIGWAGIAAIGLLTLTTFNLSVNLPFKRDQDRASLAQIREYLAHPDPSIFTRDPLHPGPHPDRKVVEQVLADPRLRPVLPAVFFTAEPETAPGRLPWVIAHGRTLLVASIPLLLAVVLWPRRRAAAMDA